MPTRKNPAQQPLQPAPSVLDNIRIVLVRTFHPGNIGSVARAMKTMGLSNLALVSPKEFPSDEANKMALSADDLLLGASVFSSIAEATADCQIVVASTARIREHDLPELSPEQCAGQLLNVAKQAPVALLLGPERMGLHNDDIQHASHRVTIPTSPLLQSLNIAAAAQTLCYEIYKQFVSDPVNDSATTPTKTRELASRDDHERFYQHLEQTIRTTGFIQPGHGGPIMQRLRALFARAEPDVDEMNILRAILASVDRSIDNPKS